MSARGSTCRKKAARAARDNVIRKGAFEGLNLPSKLADCSSRHAEDCELFIVEGNSAGAHLESARFDYQSIYLLRGRVDAVYDCATSDLMKKEIIQDLSRIFGIVPGKDSDENDIIPDAVMILSDAD